MIWADRPGMEAGGRVSALSTFAAAASAGRRRGDPARLGRGIGLRSAVACVVGGAAGVVLDSQLGLMHESDLPGDIRRVLVRMDGSETVTAGRQRGIQVTGTPARLAGPPDAQRRCCRPARTARTARAFRGPGAGHRRSRPRPAIGPHQQASGSGKRSTRSLMTTSIAPPQGPWRNSRCCSPALFTTPGPRPPSRPWQR